MKKCRPNETKLNSNAIHPRKRHNNPTHSYTPNRTYNYHIVLICHTLKITLHMRGLYMQIQQR